MSQGLFSALFIGSKEANSAKKLLNLSLILTLLQ